MKYTQIIILFSILLVSIVSCKQKGCTDSNATNFDIEAEIDDNSCQFVTENIVTDYYGIYNVQDSITGPPTMEWYHNSYDIEISSSDGTQNNLIFSNYADQNNDFSGVIYSIECEVTNNIITIVEQEINGEIVRSSSGYFSNDSIFFDIEFENEFGEVFYGKCLGVKE